jgi:hypothetical protein
MDSLPFSSAPHTYKTEDLVSVGISAKQSAMQDEVRRLRVDVDRLLMITQALWSILKHEHGYDDNTLKTLVDKIDAADGRLDGQVSRQGPLVCRSCGRNNSASKPICMFCGTPLPRDLFQR